MQCLCTKCKARRHDAPFHTHQQHIFQASIVQSMHICTCCRSLYFAACKRSLQQASIVQFVMAVWLPMVEASLFVFLARWLACTCWYGACCIVQSSFFPFVFWFIAHLSKTVDVVIFSFVPVHFKHHGTFSPCDRLPLPRKCSSSLSRQHHRVSFTVEMTAPRPRLQPESRCSLDGNCRVRNRMWRKHLS